MTTNQTDIELDRAAKAHAFKNCVSYTEALNYVADAAGHQPSSYSQSNAPITVSMSDVEMDRAARAYVQVNGVSYAEALGAVPFDGAASVSEGVASSGPVLLARQPIEIFRMGTHIDNDGRSRTFTLQDVQTMAMVYNVKRHEAPFTLGHPADNKPAYGWVKSLTATPDGRLMMTADQIDPAFAEAVQAGRYKKRSASFYPPANSANPSPGNWYLKHVGWLGAQPPAIKGLADASFGSLSNDGSISFTV